jgi:hypothetical protein
MMQPTVDKVLERVEIAMPEPPPVAEIAAAAHEAPADHGEHHGEDHGESTDEHHGE